MDRWKDKVAVVTGASAGIGAAIVEQLVDAGLKVVGLARRADKLQHLQDKLKDKPGQLHAIKTDMTNETDILDAFKWTTENLGPIHVLVNNAGVVRTTTLIDGRTELWKDVIDTNVLGLCIATREAVKDMRANNVDGHIVHINSILGHSVPLGTKLNIYAASKHAVTALTETLRQELNAIGSKIRVTSISPGMVRSEIFEASDMRSGTSMEPALKAYINAGPILEASDVADAVMYVLATPPHVQVHELMIKPIGEIF